jgi:hypothetical protein
VPTNAVSEIIAGRQRITPRMALFIGKAFRTGPEIWLNLQRNYDLQSSRKIRVRGRRDPRDRAIGGLTLALGQKPPGYCEASATRDTLLRNVQCFGTSATARPVSQLHSDRDFRALVKEIQNRVRRFTPWPGLSPRLRRAETI